MKKTVFLLAALLLALCVCPAAAADGDENGGSELYQIIKEILQGKYEGEKLTQLSTCVTSLKSSSSESTYYVYIVSYDRGDHGTGAMPTYMKVTTTQNPTWKVVDCDFGAEEGYTFSAWDIYGEKVHPGDHIVLSKDYTTATALWKKA